MFMRGPAPSVSRWIGDYLAGSPVHLLRLILDANWRSAIGTALSPPATGVSTENLLRVLRIIGIMDTVVKSADPYETDVGRLRMDEILPKRVRDR